MHPCNIKGQEPGSTSSVGPGVEAKVRQYELCVSPSRSTMVPSSCSTIVEPNTKSPGSKPVKEREKVSSPSRATPSGSNLKLMLWMRCSCDSNDNGGASSVMSSGPGEFKINGPL